MLLSARVRYISVSAPPIFNPPVDTFNPDTLIHKLVLNLVMIFTCTAGLGYTTSSSQCYLGLSKYKQKARRGLTTIFILFSFCITHIWCIKNTRDKNHLNLRIFLLFLSKLARNIFFSHMNIPLTFYFQRNSSALSNMLLIVRPRS